MWGYVVMSQTGVIAAGTGGEVRVGLEGIDAEAEHVGQHLGGHGTRETETSGLLQRGDAGAEHAQLPGEIKRVSRTSGLSPREQPVLRPDVGMPSDIGSGQVRQRFGKPQRPVTDVQVDRLAGVVELFPAESEDPGRGEAVDGDEQGRQADIEGDRLVTDESGNGVFVIAFGGESGAHQFFSRLGDGPSCGSSTGAFASDDRTLVDDLATPHSPWLSAGECCLEAARTHRTSGAQGFGQFQV